MTPQTMVKTILILVSIVLAIECVALAYLVAHHTVE